MGLVLNWSSSYPATLDTIETNFPVLTDGVHDVITTHVNTIAEVVVALQNVVGGLRNAPIQDPLSISEGQILVWSEANSRFEPADEVGIGLQYTIAGATNASISTPDVEFVVGGFTLNPNLFTGVFIVSYEFYGILHAIGEFTTLTVRLYDMGTSISPEVGTLVSTFTVSNGEKGFNVKKAVTLTPVGTPALSNEIYNAKRMYELRLELVGGATGDSATMLWGGIKVI